ncbi:MAG: hypothetical protein AAF353_12300, partial [Pseudomonadota bacterium]
AADRLAVLRNRKLLKAQLNRFGKISPRHLRDIGLDDPQAQLQLLDGFIHSSDRGTNLDYWHSRSLIQR